MVSGYVEDENRMAKNEKLCIAWSKRETFYCTEMSLYNTA